MLWCLSIVLSARIWIAVVAAPSTSNSPVVHLDYGSFEGLATSKTTSFLGMPFAAPPTGKLRFQPPQPPHSFSGIRKATQFGSSCINQAPPGSAIPSTASEDCLFINVVKPASNPTNKKLPVVFWIYGGGFETGNSASFNGSAIVERSIALGEPIIYSSINYRLNGFGFLASKEVEKAGIGNVGLRDQRFALEWVHKYISSFGGDPTKVTLWGESAGAISVAFQMLINDGNPEGLFRGAFMNSGSPYALQDITSGQPFYDQLVNSTGCAKSKDTLGCLQAAPLKALVEAINETPPIASFMSLDLAWQPRLDHTLFTRSPVDAVVEGRYAKVPIVSGDCDDEGTIFSLNSLNITTDAEFLDYIHSHYVPDATPAELAAVGNAYPADPVQGSPYDTGDANVLTPQYKRIASFQGDMIFQAPRRAFLQTVSKTQDAWAFLYKRGKSTPTIGTSHGSDLVEFYTNATAANDFIGTDILINFVNHLNPTLSSSPLSLLTTSGIKWDLWNSSSSSPPLLTFTDPAPSIQITADTYRLEEMSLLSRLSFEFSLGI